MVITMLRCLLHAVVSCMGFSFFGFIFSYKIPASSFRHFKSSTQIHLKWGFLIVAYATCFACSCARKRVNFILCLYYFLFFVKHFMIPFGKCGPPYPGKATAAARAALPSPTSACRWVFSCFRNTPNSNMDYRIFNVRT